MCITELFASAITGVSLPCRRGVVAVLFTAIVGGAVVTSWAKDGGAAAAKSKSVLESVSREIGKEPKYLHKPRYALVVLGTNADAKMWVVEDGETLYVDKNFNGDLTDDGPPVERKVSPDLCDYTLDAVGPEKGPKHTEFCLRRWGEDKGGAQYGLSLSLNGTTRMYAGWFGTFWSDSPKTVPVIQFGGPLTPTLLARRGVFALDSKIDSLDIGFINGGSTEGAKSYLSIEALPEKIVPEVRIDWPVAPGAAPLQTTEQLTERCCYWNYYKKGFRIPAGVVEGDAVLTISLPTGEMPLPLATNQIKVPVRAKAGK
jgi:hypothetical protein